MALLDFYAGFLSTYWDLTLAFLTATLGFLLGTLVFGFVVLLPLYLAYLLLTKGIPHVWRDLVGPKFVKRLRTGI